MAELPVCRLCNSLPMAGFDEDGEDIVYHDSRSDCPLRYSEDMTPEQWNKLMGQGGAVAYVNAEIFNAVGTAMATKKQSGHNNMPLYPAPAVDDGVVRDAARYRWLRSNNVGPSQIEKVSDDYSPPYFTLKCENELDAAVDAAIKEQQDAKADN